MSWENEVKEIKKRLKLIQAMGGKEKIKRQYDAGRTTVRERIFALVDKGSFKEIGRLTGLSEYDEDGTLKSLIAVNSVIGHALINKVPTVIYGDDFTIRGGAGDAAIYEKMITAERFANEYRMPLIRLIEGTGGGGSVKSIEADGYTYVPANPGWDWVVSNMATIPVVSLGLGPVAGLGAARLVSSHYSIIVKKMSQVFVAGPPVVNRLGETVTKESLGGSEIHGKNGVIDEVADSEADALAKAKKFLSYLPSSTYEIPKKIKNNDPIDRKDNWLISAIPKNRRHSYEIRPIIESITDKNSFFEIGKNWGTSSVSGFARLDGWPIVVLANDPQVYGGGWTADASQKIIRILETAETFHLPVLHLVDNPGFLVGTHGEKAGTIRHGARALAAIYQLSTPICSIILRRAFGVAGAAHMNHTKHRYRFAWPSGDWGSLPLEGGIEAAYKSDLIKSDNPEKLLKELEEKLNHVRSPFRTAEKFSVEDIIDPRDTRKELCYWISLAGKNMKAGPVSFGMRP
jgi:acetyl-CoA carboxylase carboxyltransferase component